jgi:hypothetical protein
LLHLFRELSEVQHQKRPPEGGRYNVNGDASDAAILANSQEWMRHDDDARHCGRGWV